MRNMKSIWLHHYSVGAPLMPPPGLDPWQAALDLRDTARRHILARLGEPDAARPA